VRIGPNELLTNDIEVFRKTSAVRSSYTRSNWYDGLRFDPGHNNVLSERDEKIHSALRTKMAAGVHSANANFAQYANMRQYSGKENEHLEESVDANIAQLIELLSTKHLSNAGNYKPVDLAPRFQYFTLDVIADIAFGKPMGNLQADEDVWAFIQAVQEGIPLVVFLGAFPRFSQIFFSRLWQPFWPKATDTRGLGKLMGYVPRIYTSTAPGCTDVFLLFSLAQEVVGERFGPNEKTRRDMIGSFVRHGLSQRQVEAEAVLQLFIFPLFQDQPPANHA